MYLFFSPSYSPQVSPVRQGLDLTGYVSPSHERRVWPKEMKEVRDKVISSKRFTDAQIYFKPEEEERKELICFSSDQLEYDEAFERDLHHRIRSNRALTKSYGDFLPPLIEPTRYRVLMCNNRPYRVGHGAFGFVFMGQDKNKDNGELVAIKAFSLEDKNLDTDRILSECGFFHRGQQLLGDEFEKAHLRGFMKIRSGTEMDQCFLPLICVVTLAGMTKNVPISCSLAQLRVFEACNTGRLSREVWSDILYNIVKAVQVLNEGGIQHRDYHSGNIVIGYHNGKYKLTIIDFGASVEQTGESSASVNADLYKAMNVLQDTANVVKMKNTRNYALSILANKPKEGTVEAACDWAQVLEGLSYALENDNPSG